MRPERRKSREKKQFRRGKAKSPPQPHHNTSRTPTSPHPRVIQDLETRLAEAEETLRAIRSGEVDAVVVAGRNGDQVFTLQGAESNYRFLVEEMNEGALLLGPEGTILYANARFAAMAEVPLEGVIGVSWESFFVPEERPTLAALLEGEETRSRREARLQLKNNSERPVTVSVCSLNRQDIEGFSVVVADLTERKAAENVLKDTNALLNERSARLQEMVDELQHVSYSIIHDMRAPLRAMQGFATMLEEEAADSTPEQRKEYCRRILAGAKRVDMQITDALQYTKAVLQHLPMQPVPLTPVIQGLLETYPDLHPAKADIRVEGTLPVVIGNESLLTQCFANLLGNAVKFVAPGTRPQVRIRAESTPEGSRIWVEDNGIGIPESAQSRLFGLFERLTSGYEGTGVGLAIVRKVVERMGGKVGVESAEGRGSRFWVSLQTASPQIKPARASSRREQAGRL